MVRGIEFYVLYTNKTWGTHEHVLTGTDANLPDDEAVEVARTQLTAEWAGDPAIECIGPLYHIGEQEESQ